MAETLVPVTGTDGIAPVYDPEGLWRIWDRAVMWDGTVGHSRWVPRVSDYVIDPQTFETWIVEHLDAVTLIPGLKVIRPANMSATLSETDILFGMGPGTQADTYRVYIDDSVMPHTLAVDARLKVAGTMASHARLFKGSDLSGTGHVISKLYDSSGHVVSDLLPLELVAIDNHVNYAIRCIPVCYTSEDLADGEIVTAVIYDDAGHVISKRQLLAENTAFIRQANVSRKYVTHIALECPFMSPTFDHVIEYPINVPIGALNPIGIVYYSDGSTLRLPVDGIKFRLYGLDQYVSTIVGQRLSLVLSYSLSPEEAAYGGVTADGKFITEPYTIQTVNPNNSYTVKLFGYPVWVDSNHGYTLQWFLLNLDRNVFFDVTPYVRFAENTGAFDPLGFGYLQRKAVVLNLRDVSGAFRPFIHTQLVSIYLKSSPIDMKAPWEISLESNASLPAFGTDLFAQYHAEQRDKTEIHSGILTQETWLQKFYYQSFPLIDRYTDSQPLPPTHFDLIYGSSHVEYTLDQWNATLSVGAELQPFKTLFIRFSRRTQSGVQYLSIVGINITPML